MTDLLDDRKKGFEAKFKMDQEMEFKVDARRNKLLGLWLAEKLGLPESDYDAYAKEVVLADLDEPGIEDVVRKVMLDIDTRDANISRDDVLSKIEELQAVAISEIKDKLK